MRIIFLTACFALLVGSSLAYGHGKGATVEVHHAWVRPTPPGTTLTAMYGVIHNSGNEPDRLLSASCSAARAAEIHEVVTKDGMMHMRPVEGGVMVPARGEAALAPGGYHLMLIGLKRPVKPGDTLKVRLTFLKAGTIEVHATAAAIGGGAPHRHKPGHRGPGQGEHHKPGKHHKMQ